MTVEAVTRVVGRGKVYEHLYTRETLAPPHGPLEMLQESMLELYTAVLRCLAHSSALFGMGSFQRALHAVFQPEKTKDLIDKISYLDRQAESIAHLCHSKRSAEAESRGGQRLQLLHEMLCQLREPMLRIDRRVSDMLEKLLENQQLELLEWFSDVLFGSHHGEIQRLRVDGTCEWLLKHPRFRKWHNSPSSSILFLEGSRKSHFYPFVSLRLP